MSAGVDLDNVSCDFGTFRAVDNANVTIKPGEFFSFLGPSGCGKTTILRMISGFIDPSEGAIRIGGKDMKGTRPNQRPTALIFQNLALFPLMPVWENIAFGLEVRGVDKAKRRAQGRGTAAAGRPAGCGRQGVSQLSGGQKQRVAIARALAVEPSVMLLDEPLSALDLKLRQHMRAELRAIQKRTDVTFIYITHDQGEALAMSDRVGVMSQGKLQQVATPRDIYNNPANGFVASFVGENNIFAGQISRVQRQRRTLRDGDAGMLQGHARPRRRRPTVASRLYVRPEHARLCDRARCGGNSIPVDVTDVASRATSSDPARDDRTGRHLVAETRNDGTVTLPPGEKPAHICASTRPMPAILADDSGMKDPSMTNEDLCRRYGAYADRVCSSC